MTGGDSVTEGVATAEYCTAAGTGCDAQINTGNYKTTYPYIELELPSADHVNGGQNFTLPTVSAPVHGDRLGRDGRQRDRCPSSGSTPT